MSETPLKVHHVLIPRSALFFDRPVFFDLFVKLNDHFVKVLNDGEYASAERIDKYLSKNEDVLYILSTSIGRFMDELFAKLFDKITDGNSVHERIQSFIRCAELCYLDVKLVRPTVDKFMRFGMLAQAGYELYRNVDFRKILLYEMTHTLESKISREALLGATFGLSLYQEQNDCPALAFKNLFIGAVLRDLSLQENETTSQQTYFSHPDRTVEILRGYNVVDDTMETIIKQHHEKPLGDGFPLRLKRVETYPPAQCLCLGDWLVNQMEEHLSFPKCENAAVFVQHIQDTLPEENQRKLPVILRVLTAAFRLPANNQL